MIKPVGSDELHPLFVYDSTKHHELTKEAESLPSIIVSSQAAANAVMMGSGYFNPLTGYMNVADAMGAAEKMILTDGSFFPVPVMNQVEVTREYKISGITISSDGPHIVWINATAYEDGEKLEDKSRIKVMVGDEIRVRVTAPDGKNYYATSGETLEVTYLASVEN